MPCRPSPFLLRDVLGGVIWDGIDGCHLLGDRHRAHCNPIIEIELDLDIVALPTVAGPSGSDCLPVVIGKLHVGLVRNARFDEGRRGSEKRVPARDALIEKRKGATGFDGLEPEAHLRQLDRHRVYVDAIDAATDDPPQCVANLLWRGTRLTRREHSHPRRNALSRCNKEVT